MSRFEGRWRAPRRAAAVLFAAAALSAAWAQAPAAGASAGYGLHEGRVVIARPFAAPGGGLVGELGRSAAGTEAALNGRELPLTPRLPRGTAIAAELSGLDPQFRTTVQFRGGQAIPVEAGPEGRASVRLELPEELLSAETIQVSVAPGRKGEPFSAFVPLEAYDHDDLTIDEIALLIPGREALAPERVLYFRANLSIRNRDYEGEPPIALGDGESGAREPGKPLTATFTFSVPPEAMTAFSIELDPAKAAEGEASVILTAEGSAPFPVRLRLDATPPRLSLSAPSGPVSARGELRLDAAASDDWSGVAGLSGMLDGKAVALPCIVKAASLEPGLHEFSARAVDGSGNAAEQRISFRTEKEDPAAPRLLGRRPEDRRIEVGLADPQGDALRLELRRGWILGAADGSVRGFSGVYSREPPAEMRGEADAAIPSAAIAAVDCAMAETRARSGFPGHRFELELPESPIGKVRVEWAGATLPGRSVSAWAWDYSSGAWAMKGATAAGSMAFELDPERETRDARAELLLLDPVEEKPFTVAWMSDPQYYAASYSAIYESIASWVAAEYRAGRIAYLVDTGDIVDSAVSASQWEVADRSKRIIDEAGLPYGTAAGNHDVQQESLVYDTYLHYFGDRRFAGRPERGGSWRGGIHSYDLVSFGAHDFLFLYLGYGYETDSEALDWAKEVIRSHPDRTAIICLHYYLRGDGTRSARGSAVYYALVESFPNVAAVLCGHIHGAARAEQVIELPGGGSRRVHEMLADYQSGPLGGEGFIRLLTFDPARGKLSVKTYSPYRDRWNFFPPAEDEFELDFPLPDPAKMIASDAISVEVYGDELIAGYENLASGSTARIAEPEAGSYYLVASDDYGGWSASEIFSVP